MIISSDAHMPPTTAAFIHTGLSGSRGIVLTECATIQDFRM